MPRGSGQTSEEDLGDIPAFLLAGRALVCAPGGCGCCFCCWRCWRHFALRFLNQTWGGARGDGVGEWGGRPESPHGALNDGVYGGCTSQSHHRTLPSVMGHPVCPSDLPFTSAIIHTRTVIGTHVSSHMHVCR